MYGVGGVQGNVIDDVKPSYAVQDGTWGPPKEVEKENLDDVFGKKPVSVRDMRCVRHNLRNIGGLRTQAGVAVSDKARWRQPCATQRL